MFPLSHQISIIKHTASVKNAKTTKRWACNWFLNHSERFFCMLSSPSASTHINQLTNKTDFRMLNQQRTAVNEWSEKKVDKRIICTSSSSHRSHFFLSMTKISFIIDLTWNLSNFLVMCKRHFFWCVKKVQWHRHWLICK